MNFDPTLLQTMCGTPLYVAPEVLIDSREGYNQVVDSWSLGVMLFIMCVVPHPDPASRTLTAASGLPSRNRSTTNRIAPLTGGGYMVED